MSARENGYVLLALLLVLVSVASAITLYTQREGVAPRSGDALDRAGISRKALAEAKAALIAYATANQNSPGDLPCPSPTSKNAEGATTVKGEITNCTVTSGVPPQKLIGRFPWKSLGVEPPIDGDGECLWYILYYPARSTAKSTERGSSADSPPLNANTLATSGLRFGDGSKALALLIAPGQGLAGQSRTPLSDSPCQLGAPGDFLEGAETLDTTVDIVSDATAGNDLVLPIRGEDLVRPAMRTALQSLSSEGIANHIVAQSGISAISPLKSLRDADPTKFDDLLYTSVTGASDPLNYAAGNNCPSSVVASATPARNPVFWLCHNGWYDLVKYDPEARKLSLSAFSDQLNCSLSLSDPRHLVQCP